MLCYAAYLQDSNKVLLFAGRLLFVGEKLTLTNFFRSIDSLRLISMLLQTPPPLLKVPSTMLISGGSALLAGHFSLQQVILNLIFLLHSTK